MSEQRSDAAFEARLRDLLAAELLAAEADYRSLPIPPARATRRSLRLVGGTAAVALLLGSLLLVAQLLGRAPLGPGSPTLRTFPLYVPPNGGPLVCPSYLMSPNVSGTLAGDAADPEGIWLMTSSGRISVRWPAGFTLAFDPEATLYDGDGNLFARAGDVVTLGQVPLGSHAGTPADPYLAAGLIEAKSANGDTRSSCAPAADGEPYTPSLPPTPLESPWPTAWVDPASGYSIAAPYALGLIPDSAQTEWEMVWGPMLGGFGRLTSAGERRVTQVGKGVGFIVVLTFPPGTSVDQMRAAALMNLGVDPAGATEATPIDGVPVTTFTMHATGPSPTATGALFPHGEAIVMVLPDDDSALTSITTALITANP
jgi:hypothetical protein